MRAVQSMTLGMWIVVEAAAAAWDLSATRRVLQTTTSLSEISTFTYVVFTNYAACSTIQAVKFSFLDEPSVHARVTTGRRLRPLKSVGNKVDS